MSKKPELKEEKKVNMKIPELVVYTCTTCKSETVSETGQNILCQNCVNTFLARNVGLMTEAEAEAEPPE